MVEEEECPECFSKFLVVVVKAKIALACEDDNRKSFGKENKIILRRSYADVR